MVRGQRVRGSRLIAAVALLAMLDRAAAAQTLTTDLPDAPIVVTGRVAQVRSQWHATGVIVTYVSVDVIDRVRGSRMPDRVVLRQLGGEVDGIGLWIADEPRFTAGEYVLLFLNINARDSTLHTFGQARGKRSIDTALIAELRAKAPVTTPPFTAVPPEFADNVRVAAPLFSRLPTDGGYPARWHEVDDHVSVFVDHPSSLPATWTGATANVTAAVGLWRSSGMDLDLRYGGASLGNACPISFTGSGRISVAYNDPCGITNNAETWVVGGGYYTTGELRTVNGVEYQKFLQGFVVLNDSGPQSGSAGCFQDAITHGLGHALGLGHSSDGNAMMQALPAATCGAGPRGLASDDMAGITSIYRGIASGPFPPNSPTALAATALLSTVSLSWTSATTGGPAQRHRLDAGTTSGVYNLMSAPLGPATTAAFTSVPPGTYFLRVRAQNVAGTSDPSPEASVTVGPCLAPGAPGPLAASVTGNAVTVQWSAPTMGITQGYRLLVGSTPGAANLLVQDAPATVTGLSGTVAFGTYYARVLPTNVCGSGPASNEVTILVQPCAAAPGAATNLQSSLSGRNVALTWNAPVGPAPASYTLLVGSRAGANDVLVFQTGTTATTFGAAAPPGTYFVRVVAQNLCGSGGASNEITVVVP